MRFKFKRPFRPIRFEILEPRRLLATLQWDGTTNGLWDDHWTEAGQSGNPVPAAGDTVVIQGGATTITITIPASETVSPGEIEVEGGSAVPTVVLEGGTIALDTNNISIGVAQGSSAEIDSNIIGSGHSITDFNVGSLSLGGPNGSGTVSVGSFLDDGGGSLRINEPISVTNGDNSNIGLKIAENATTLTCAGDITLSNGAPIQYVSDTASTISGSVTAIGDSNIVNEATDNVAGVYGTLNLTGTVSVNNIQDQSGTLDLNGVTTITNYDGSNSGLQVENSALLSGLGTINLTGGAPFAYSSNAQNVYSTNPNVPNGFQGTINLGTGSLFNYTSSSDSTFAGTITSTSNGVITNDASAVSGTYGILNLTGTVSVDSILDESGTLGIGGSTTITNYDGSGTGLVVENNAVLEGGTGSSLTLDAGPAGGTLPALDYLSGNQLSYFDGPINGAGGITMNAVNYYTNNFYSYGAYGAITLGSENTCSGVTDIEQGELVLGTSAGALSGPALGSGVVKIGMTGSLDLNGCSVTLSGLNDGSTANGHIGGDVQDLLDTTHVDVLTIATPAGTTDTFNGDLFNGYAGIRLVKTGAGELDLGGEDSGPEITVELDAGVLGLAGSTPGSSAQTIENLVVNGGRLDLNSVNLFVVDSLNGNGGVITDTSSNQGKTTTLYVSAYAPCSFAGVIQDGYSITYPDRPLVALVVYGSGLLTLTGDNAYSGGTAEDYMGATGRLQIGDGTTNGAIEGPVTVDTQDGLTFDVSSSGLAAFNGAIQGGGSIQKTGPGALELTGPGNSYTGAMRVEDGSVFLAAADQLAAGTDLIVDNGATVDLGGNSNTSMAIHSLTLNDGTIQSTDGSGNNLSAALYATDSFNVAQGTIGVGVELAGSASLDKRTDGTVTFEGTNSSDIGAYSGSGGIFEDQGTLQTEVNGTFASIGPATTIMVTWSDASHDGTWNYTSANWLVGGATTSTDWPTDDGTTNYVAVFPNGLEGTVTIGAQVTPVEIEFGVGGYDIKDDGVSNDGISVLNYRSLLVTVPANDTDSLGCFITGGGSVTKEGCGTLIFGNSQDANSNSYLDGTFADAGIIQLGSSTALGTANSGPDAANLVVDDCGKIDLHGLSPTISSLNSSYAVPTLPPSPPAPDGTITDTTTSGGSQTALIVDVGAEPGLFAGEITASVSLSIGAVGSQASGLLMTLSGEVDGAIDADGGLQIGDGTNTWTIGGAIDIGVGTVVFEVPPANGNNPESFAGSVEGTAGGNGDYAGSVLVVSSSSNPGTLQFGGAAENLFDSGIFVDGATLEVESTTALPVGTGVTLDNGATLNLNGYSYVGALPTANPLFSLTVNNGTVEGGTLDVSGLTDVCDGSFSSTLALSGGALLKSPANTNTTDTFTIYGTTETDSTIVDFGTLKLGSSQALASSTNLIIDGGTLDLGGEAVDVNTVTMGNGGGQIGGATGSTLSAGSFLFAPDSADPATVSAPLVGTASITMFGTGTLVLSGVNTYSGGSVVTDGTLEVDGTVADNVLVRLGGTLDGDGTCAGSVDVQSGGTLMLGGASGSGTITIGALTLENDSSVIDNDASLKDTFLASITDTTGGLAIGTGVMLHVTPGSVYAPYQVLFQYASLGNPSSYDDLSTNSGVLINDTTASSIDLSLLTGSAQALYWGGGSDWNGSSSNTDWLTASRMAANWVDGDVAVFEGAGTNTVTLNSGSVSPAEMLFLSGSYTINGLGTAALPANTPIFVATGVTATISVSIADATGVSGSLAVSGGGTLALAGADSYSGGTTIDGGTVVITGDDSLGATTASPNVTFDGNGVLQWGASFGISANRTIEIESGVTATFDAQSYSIVVPGVISGGGNLDATAGTGTLTLTGASSYTGSTTVQAGIVEIENASALGTMTAGVYVNNGATLELAGSPGFAVSTAGILYLGAGSPTSGGNTYALDNASGTNYWSGPIVLDSSAYINSDSGTLILTGGINAVSANTTLTFEGAGNVTVAGAVGIGSNVGVVSDGVSTSNYDAGTVTILAPSSFTGDLKIYGGELVASPAALPTDSLYFGGSSGLFGGNSGTGIYLYTGTLVLGGEGPANITLSSIYVGSGATLDLGGNTVTVDGSVTLANGSIIDGTIIVANSSGSYVLENGTISASLGGTAALLMEGNGNHAVLTGDNTYSGGTTVVAGTLSIQNGSALGSTTAGVTVDSGATLQLEGNITVAASFLDLAGQGVGGMGALVSIASATGQNEWSGPIVLETTGSTQAASTLIESDAGSLVLTSGTNTTHAINGQSSGSSLSFAGAGNVVIVGDGGGIGADVNNIYKTGSGTVILATADVYTGSIYDDGGEVSGASPYAFSGGWTVGPQEFSPDTPSIIIVDGGATLDLGGYSVTVAGAVTLVNGSITDGTITSAAWYNVENGTISANLEGSDAGLTMSGAGTVTLSGDNTYTGGTDVDAGTLVAQTTGSLPAAAVTITDGTLILDSGTSPTTGSSITIGSGGTLVNDGALTISEGGSLTIVNGGILSNAGTATITGGTVYVDMYSSLLNSGSLSFSSAEVTIDQGQDANYNDWQGAFTSTGGSIAFSDGSTFTNYGVLTLTNTRFSADASSIVNNGGVLIASGSQISLGGTTNSSYYEIPDMANTGDLFGYLLLFDGSMYLTDGSTLTNAGTLTCSNIIALDHTSEFLNTGSGQSFLNQGDVLGTLENDGGQMTLNPGELETSDGGVITNTSGGVIEMEEGGLITLPANSSGTGTLNNTDGAVITIDGSNFTNGASLTWGFSTVNNDVATINVVDASLFHNYGVYNSAGGTLNIEDSEFDNGNTAASTHAYAAMNLSDGATVTVDDASVFSDYGSVSILTGSTFSNAGAATFMDGAVYVDGTSSLLNSGTLGFSNGSALTNSGATVNSGVLTVGSGGTLDNYSVFTNDADFTIASGGLVNNNATINGDVVDNGALWYACLVGTETYAGNLSGSGEFVAVAEDVSPNVLTLSGDNSGFSGIFDFYVGTVQVGSAMALGSGGATLLGGGNLDLNGHSISINAIQMGGGTITNNGGGNAVITITGGYDSSNPPNQIAGETICDGSPTSTVGLNIDTTDGVFLIYDSTLTYTGGTTINAGSVLELGYGGTTEALCGTVVDNGELVIVAGTSSVTYTCNISGSGTVIVGGWSGTAAVILTGTDSATTTTITNGGTLQIGDGTTNGSVTGSIVDNAILEFVQNSAATVNTAISGNSAAQIQNNGAGELTLTGLDAYYGSLGSGIES